MHVVFCAALVIAEREVSKFIKACVETKDTLSATSLLLKLSVLMHPIIACGILKTNKMAYLILEVRFLCLMFFITLKQIK